MAYRRAMQNYLPWQMDPRAQVGYTATTGQRRTLDLMLGLLLVGGYEVLYLSMKLACSAGVLTYGVADLIWRLAVVPASSIALCLIAFRCLGFALPALIGVLRVRLHTWLWPLAAPGCRALAGCDSRSVDLDDRRMAMRCFIVFSSTTVVWLAVGGALSGHWLCVQLAALLALLQVQAFRDRL